MRKILSGFLATAMVASVCATASFAATIKSENATINFVPKAPVKNATDVFDAVQFVRLNGGDPKDEEVLGEVRINLDTEGVAVTAADVAHAVHGVTFRNVDFGGKIYQVALKTNSAGDSITATISPAVKIDGVDANDTYKLVLVNEDHDKDVEEAAAPVALASVGAGGETVDIDWNGTELDVRDVVVCDGQGYPIPLTETSRGVDKDLNGDDGIQSGSTVYFMIKDNEYKFGSDDYWKLKISKGDNGKYIKALSDVTKKFSGNMYNAINGEVVQGTGGARYRYIKAELNEIYTDDEIKISLDMRLTAKDAAVERIGVDDDTEFKVNDFTFYMKNLVKAADGDWRVGVGGLMLNPVKNDWNEVTYYDEDGDLAYLKFFGDSDTGKFYAKLSTKWEHADYASYFNDQDAYIFQFTGSPSLSSTSRADLQIYSPFVDDDGNETFDPEQAVIYQVVDGDLFDITDSFTYEEGDNGDMAFCTRTRFLGTYIICQKPVDEASNDDVVDLVPDDLVPDDNTNAPVDVTPGNNGGSGSKAPANTGKF